MSEPYTEHFGRIVILVQYVNAEHLEYECFLFGIFFALIFSRTFSVARIFFCFFPPTPVPHHFSNGPSVSKQNTDLKCHRKLGLSLIRENEQILVSNSLKCT